MRHLFHAVLWAIVALVLGAAGVTLALAAGVLSAAFDWTLTIVFGVVLGGFRLIRWMWSK